MLFGIYCMMLYIFIVCISSTHSQQKSFWQSSPWQIEIQIQSTQRESPEHEKIFKKKMRLCFLWDYIFFVHILWYGIANIIIIFFFFPLLEHHEGRPEPTTTTTFTNIQLKTKHPSSDTQYQLFYKYIYDNISYSYHINTFFFFSTTPSEGLFFSTTVSFVFGIIILKYHKTNYIYHHHATSCV